MAAATHDKHDVAAASDADDEAVYNDFKEAVNMTASALTRWLKTDESKGDGGDDESKESVGHKSGERIVEILHKKKADLTGDDYAHLRKVVGYIRRHSAQRPEGDVADTRWAYSLKNWGHDPTKKGG